MSRIINKTNERIVFTTDDEKAVIKIGRNAIANTTLFDEAKPNDHWFHLRNLPSTHVYLSIDDSYKIPKNEMKRLFSICANYVKIYSKCDSKSKVITLQKKHLAKGTLPGEIDMKKSPVVI
jgi:predicted ribosome quality control (RQC) complex YloA/Tae2 family protein